MSSKVLGLTTSHTTATHAIAEGRPETGEYATDWLLTSMAALLVLTLHVSFLISLLLGVGDHPIKLPLRSTLTLFVAGCTLLLLARRRSPSRALCTGVFAAVTVPFLLTFWLNEEVFAATGRLGTTWELFLGPKLAMFVVASLCPLAPSWVAPTLLAAFGLEQVAMWFALDLGSPLSHVGNREPWLSISCAGLATVLLACRMHHSRREHELAVTRADASVLRRTNQAFLAVQDMANTPIQNLEIALALMEEQHRGDPLVGAARRSVVRLRELSHHLPVDEVTEAAVDSTSLERVRRLQRERG